MIKPQGRGNGVMMLESITDAGENWGHWMRKPPEGWPKSSPLMRIKEHGKLGGAIHSHKTDYAPIADNYITDRDALAFHKAWNQQDSIDQAVIYVCFAIRCGIRRKLALLKSAEICKSQTRMYEMRKDALYRIQPAWSTAYYGN